MNNSWHTLKKIHPPALLEARLQLHYAIQLIAATGAALAEPLPDYSHTSLAWNPDLEVFVGSLIRSPQPFQVALDPISLTIILLNKHSTPIASCPLAGKTMAEGLVWLQQEVAQLGADANKIVFLDYPPNDFPDHALAHGAVFDLRQEWGLSELVDYYANTYSLLQDRIAIHEEVSAIRIWPHHFDMAALMMLPGIKNGTPRTIGVGLSPGDPSYSEPYWYVSPYPYPDITNLPPLDGEGFWHTHHWVGAVLPASRLTGDDHAEIQRQQVEAFLHSAITTSTTLLKS
ncbi:hypothetical protein K9N68_35135 (plasmid) [Kovacikia minuta CCNUW1]|uniref:hypothetical protein n=1 Tax=Kovacikia minuta TaxID=2931930 RepID=UPI001CCCFF36|nr:hypothetical protein [Kovacikia minuta]UBF30434.1 hypothetical protein K9N68_35135 [Kovacikia minuta CCNUW1]